jgi:hypothetical protein
MKVIDKTLSENETSVEIDLFEGRRLPAKVKRRIQDEVGDYLVEQTLISMNEKKSPVSGAPNFPALSKNYKKKKLAEVGSTEANLEFDGIMKDEINFERTESGVAIGVYGERAGAADGHNNLSGKSNLPLRQFLPDQGQSYKKQIAREVERIIVDIVAEEMTFKKSDFKEISTKAELYDKLKEIFGDLSRSELQTAAFRNEDLIDILAELDLVELL